MVGGVVALFDFSLIWLFVLVMPRLVAVGLAYLLALHFTTQAYDRSLHASILDIERQLTVVDNRPAIDLPPAAIQILEWNDEDRVYYRVATASGRHIAGEPKLPAPPPLATGHTRYFDAQFANATVRVAAAGFCSSSRHIVVNSARKASLSGAPRSGRYHSIIRPISTSHASTSNTGIA